MVPLLIWGPNHIKQQGTTSALANLVDLPRTFLTLAGEETPQEFQGTDLTPFVRGESNTTQDAVLVELRATENTLNQHTLITDRHKLVVYQHTTEGELYDLHEDPDQYINLWITPSSQRLKTDLLHRLGTLHMEREPRGPKRVSFA